MSAKKCIAVMVLLAAVGGFLFAGNTASAREPVTVEYYYYDPCESCDAEETYEKEFRKSVADVAGEDDYILLMKDVSDKAYYEEYMQLVEEKKAEGASAGSALLVIGDSCLYGMNQISEEARDVMIRELYEDKSLEEALGLMAGIDPSDSFLVYFYMPDCSSCQKVEDYLKAMDRETYVEEAEELSRVKTVYINLGNLEMVPLANWFYEKYQVAKQDRKAPVIFYQNGYLQGFEDIRDGLPAVLRKGQARGWQEPDYQEGELGESDGRNEWFVLVLTGLANGLNPCGMSLLLLLVSLLLAKKGNVVKLGLSFILAKFLVYLLLGVTCGAVFSQAGELVMESVQRILKWVLALVFLGLAFLNFVDMALARQERYGKMKLQLPPSLRKFQEQYLERILNQDTRCLTGLVFLAGIVVSAGEFLCTGQLYLASILYVMERRGTFAWASFGEFAVYVACMCVPLVLVVAVVGKGRAVFSVSELARKKIWLVKLLYGGAFLAFAVLMLIQ